MKKIINTLLVILWVVVAGCIVLPLIPNIEPITNLLKGLRNYLVAGFIVLTLIGILCIILGKYRSEVNDDDKKLLLKDTKKAPTNKEVEQLFADLQLAEFTLNGEEKAGAKPSEPLTRKKLLRESLAVTTLSKKEAKKVEKAQVKAEQKAAKERAKGVYLINNIPKQEFVQFRNRKHSWIVWILLIAFYLLMAGSYAMILQANPGVEPTMNKLHTMIYGGLFILGSLVALITLIVKICKHKNVWPAFGIYFLVITILARYSVYLCGEYGYFNLNNIGAMLSNTAYVLYNVGFVGTFVMLIVFIAHYSRPKYLYLTHEQIRAKEEKLIAKEKAVADKIAAKEAKKAEEERIAAEKAEAARLAAEKAEEERLAAEAAAAEKAEQERLAAEQAAAEKAEQERLAAEAEAARIAEEERIAAEKKAEEERLAKEKAEQEAALKAELERLAAEKAAAEKAKKPAKLIKLKAAPKAKYNLWEGLDVNVASGWNGFMQQEAEKPYYKDLMSFVEKAYEANNVYPSKQNLFKCFEYADLNNTKVVILGKLPFYRKDQADGLAYSTKAGSAMNQTTKVIVQEAVNDVGIKNGDKGSFVNWAKQGVLLLNSIMTAPADKPASHADCGWVTFTDGIIETLNNDDRPKVFILWGEYAREKASLITNPKHMILEAPNPSPLSAANGFYGSKPFSKTNEFLVNNGYEPIDWEL